MATPKGALHVPFRNTSSRTSENLGLFSGKNPTTDKKEPPHFTINYYKEKIRNKIPWIAKVSVKRAKYHYMSLSF